ncbi:C2H2 type zinc-finger-domain-containing protein [Melampsora americana]|nr:C2H2 type zinc-finger-domain-containing protein [Melampsora americana]
MNQPTPSTTAITHPYTCLACSLAFTTPHAQRTHYTTDLHRYNAKRRIVGLDPLDSTSFDSKLLNIHSSSASTHPINQSGDSHNLSLLCETCNKSFATLGAQSSHLISKKHKTLLANSKTQITHPTTNEIKPMETEPLTNPTSSQAKQNNSQDQDANIESLIAIRLNRAPRIAQTECLFCPRRRSFETIEHNFDHMLKDHGFFIPETQFLTNRSGLFDAIAERISVWNVCLYCTAGFGGTLSGEDQSSDRQEELARLGLERVRKHMCDKNHCKMAWDNQEDRLEYSDYYDYRSTHSDSKKKGNDGEWEDMSSSSENGDQTEMQIDSTSDDELPPAIHFGDSPFELVLPNGTRLGHRSLRQIYKQNLLPYAIGGNDSNSKVSHNMKMITRLARLSLIPAHGGGASHDHQLIKARNPGEAREAGRHIREFRDAQRREQFKTRVGCTSGNNQKHYRDPLLQ